MADATITTPAVKGGPDHHQYPCLDGLRALAAATVFAYHAVVPFETLHSAGSFLLTHLDIGVKIFFILSGFLIYRPFARAHIDGAPTPELRGYLRRRLLRIFPAYIVVLLVLIPLGRAHVDGITGFLKHVTLTFTYFHDQGGNGLFVSWTLVVELSFYLFVPLWAFGMRRISRGRRAIPFEVAGAIALVGFGYAAIWWRAFGSPPPPMLVLPPGLAALGMGMLLAIIVSAAPKSDALARVQRGAGQVPALIWWAMGIGLFVWLGSLSTGRFDGSLMTSGSVLRQQWIQPVVALCLVIPAIFGPQDRDPVRRLLRFRPVVYLGLVSYGFYLWQTAIIEYVRIGSDKVLGTAHSVPGDVALFVLAFALTVGVASLSYFLIERRVLRLARRPVGAWFQRTT